MPRLSISAQRQTTASASLAHSPSLSAKRLSTVSPSANGRRAVTSAAGPSVTDRRSSNGVGSPRMAPSGGPTSCAATLGGARWLTSTVTGAGSTRIEPSAPAPGSRRTATEVVATSAGHGMPRSTVTSWPRSIPATEICMPRSPGVAAIVLASAVTPSVSDSTHTMGPVSPVSFHRTMSCAGPGVSGASSVDVTRRATLVLPLRSQGPEAASSRAAWVGPAGAGSSLPYQLSPAQAARSTMIAANDASFVEAEMARTWGRRNIPWSCRQKPAGGERLSHSLGRVPQPPTTATSPTDTPARTARTTARVVVASSDAPRHR